MPSPFPGFDPYIESQINWLDFHGDLLGDIKRSLMSALPSGFVAEADVYVSIVHSEPRKSGEPKTSAREADVTVFRTELPNRNNVAVLPSRQLDVTSEKSTVVPPESVPATSIRQRYLRVIDARGEKPVVVALIELLSPTNKEGMGFLTYEKKQAQILSAEVHFMEIDLLRGGLHTVFVSKDEIESFGSSDYVVTLRDVFNPDLLSFWRIGLREPLPTVLLPLTPDVAPVPLDLQATFTRCYDANFIERRVDYGRPLKQPPFSPEDAVWADEVLRTAGLRS